MFLSVVSFHSDCRLALSHPLCLFHHSSLTVSKCFNVKKGKRKVQGVPQSQTAALPRHQEEEETDTSKQAQIKQTYEKHQD